MRSLLIGAALSVAGVVSAGSAGFLDVSTGTHEITSGSTLAYMVARGDAVVTLSGGVISSAHETGLSGAQAGSDYGTGAVVAGVVGVGAAQVQLNSGTVVGSVAALGSSNVWVGADASVRDAMAHENGTLTFHGSPDEGAWYIESYGDSTVYVRGGLLRFGAFAYDDSVMAITGGANEGGVSAYSRSYVEIVDGVVRGEVESRDASACLVRGGRVDGDATSAGHSRFTLGGGSVGSVRAGSREPFVMTGGVVRDGVRVETAFDASGGSINGVVSSDAGVARFDVRYVVYDHDDDPVTASVPLAFGDSETVVIHPGDPRLRPIAGGLGEGMAGLRVVWFDGSESVFDFRGGSVDAAWSGRLEFHRSSLVEDLNADGGVDVLDLALFLGQFGGTGTADFNGDGGVDVLDLVRFLQAWANDR